MPRIVPDLASSINLDGSFEACVDGGFEMLTCSQITMIGRLFKCDRNFVLNVYACNIEMAFRLQ